MAGKLAGNSMGLCLVLFCLLLPRRVQVLPVMELAGFLGVVCASLVLSGGGWLLVVLFCRLPLSS